MAGIWEQRSIFRLVRMVLLASLGLMAVFIEAAPLGLTPDALPSPDLLFCVIAYWALRRPGSTPMLLVFALGLCRDFLTDAPVGAGALSLVLAAEGLKQVRGWVALQPLPLEWAVIGLVAAGTLALQWLLVVITLGQPPYLSQIGLQLSFTFLAYLPVLIAFRWILRIGWRQERSVRAR
ncbi:MAG: rod shape-determining protein MreD [Pseudomonadota bacterium]